MLNIDEKQFAHALLALEQDPQPIHLELGKTEAWSLLSTIQLAARHPIPNPTVDSAVAAMKRHEGAIAQNDKVLEEVILAGWENRSPSTPQAATAAAMKAASNDIKLIITKYEAYCFFGAIQLAFRHPEYKQSLAAQRCENLARELQRAIAPDGLLATVLEMGWDESIDVEQERASLQTVEVHNVWAVYGVEEDGSEVENPFAQFSRPQDWGHPRWHYEKFKFEWEREDKHFINHCHCWTDIKRSRHEYPQLFAPLIVQILMPGSNSKLCGREYLDEDDFWSQEWGEMPPYAEVEEDWEESDSE